MMNRRNFLKASSALPLALALPGTMAQALSKSRNTIVVIDGISAASDAGSLSATME